MTKSMKFRLALVVVLGSYIAWQQYQRQSTTIITTQSVLENTHRLSGSAELWSVDARQAGTQEEGGSMAGVSGDGAVPAQSSLSDPVSQTDPENSIEAGNGPVPQTAPVQQDQELPASPLSPVVFDAINNIQQLMMDEQWDVALEQLNTMYEQRDQLNGFERSTMLMFYTNVLVHHQMYDEATIVYQEVVTIPETHASVRDRALRALEQLNARAQP